MAAYESWKSVVRPDVPHRRRTLHRGLTLTLRLATVDVPLQMQLPHQAFYIQKLAGEIARVGYGE